MKTDILDFLMKGATGQTVVTTTSYYMDMYEAVEDLVDAANAALLQDAVVLPVWLNNQLREALNKVEGDA